LLCLLEKVAPVVLSLCRPALVALFPSRLTMWLLPLGRWVAPLLAAFVFPLGRVRLAKVALLALVAPRRLSSAAIALPRVGRWFW
jgi:hypothetical protein